MDHAKGAKSTSSVSVAYVSTAVQTAKNIVDSQSQTKAPQFFDYSNNHALFPEL